MSNEKTRFTLRVDTDLFEIVKTSAKNNCRSAAMEIEYALNAYYTLKPVIDYERALKQMKIVEDKHKGDPFIEGYNKFLKTDKN